jgi:hypothetical protein
MLPDSPFAAEFVPRAHAITALRRWWVIAAAVLLGGLAGWGMHALRPTVYEARFEVLLNLDQTASGELERFEEDTALDAAGAILGGAQVLEEVSLRAVEQGILVNPADLAKMSTVERRRSTWIVRVRGADPDQAQKLVEIWQDRSYAALQDAHEAALSADRLQRSLTSLESCLERTAASPPAEGLCGAGNLAALQTEMARLGMSLTEERRRAHGLTGFVLLGNADQTVLPPQPVANGRGTLILAGALIGLVCGVWAGQLNPRGRQER